MRDHEGCDVEHKFELSDDEFEQFRKVIYENSGISFSQLNRPVLNSRIRERLHDLQLQDAPSYLAKLQKDQRELTTLLDRVTTNFTKFFREKAQLDTLESIILPALVRERSETLNRKIKIWSAGCSTGEEPYSIAITVAEALGAEFESWDIDILASDLSFEALMTANEGNYPADRLSTVDSWILDRYFTESDRNTYTVSSDIKKLCRFDYHNLKYEHGEVDHDVIFCRNVIIYFDRSAQEQVVQRFYNALKPGGYLFLGHSESLFGMDTQFKFVKVGDAVGYRKEA